VKFRNFALVRDFFKNKYPQHAKVFTRLGLMNRFHHILRLSLKKLKKIVEQRYSDTLYMGHI